LISFNERPVYKLIASGRNIQLNSIIEMNPNLFLSSGNIIEFGISKSYFVSFHSDLSLDSIFIDSSSIPSINFKSIKLNENMAVTAAQCQSTACLKFIFVDQQIKLYENLIYQNGGCSSGFTGLILSQDTQIFAAGFKTKVVSSTISNNLLFSSFNLIPFCPSNQIFKKENFMCFENCTQAQTKGSKICTLFKQGICTKCETLTNHSCIYSKFEDNYQFCGNNQKFKLISKSASYNPSSSRSKFNLKRKLNKLEKRMLDSSSNDGSISAEFETTPQYRNFPIKLQLIDSKGIVSNEITYSYYQFLDTKLVINQVTILGIGDFQSIQIDLTILQITNSLGVPLDNPIITVPIQELSDSEGINSLKNFANNLANFISENQ